MSITALRIITAAAEYPVTLAEVKGNLRVTHNFEDGEIQSLIAVATDWAQTRSGRIFVNTEVGIRIDRFPESGDSAELRADPLGQWFTVSTNSGRKKEAQKRDQSFLLPGGNVTAVNQIDYSDSDGNPQTLTGPTSAAPGTDYQEDLTDDEWSFVYPNLSNGWPAVDSLAINAVLVNYQVGWATPNEVPESIRHAIKFKIADLFTIRDSGDAGNRSKLLAVAENLLEPYIVPNF